MIVDASYEKIWKVCLDSIMRSEITAESRGKSFKEIMGLQFCLTNPYDRIVWNSTRNANYAFAMKLFIWILNGCDDADFLTGINPNAKNFLKDGKDKQFVTAYGPRIHRQLPRVIMELLSDEGSRRAVINVLQEDDKKYYGQDKIEFPCLESITFLIRDNELHCSVNMRSNNMFTTVVYDVFVLTMLQEQMLKALNFERDALNQFPLIMGRYMHHCSSAHIYESDFETVNRALRNVNTPFMGRFDEKN